MASIGVATASSSSSAGPSREDGVASMSTVQDLIRHVTRAFYETRHIVVLDQLMRKEAMKDEELAGRLGINTKDLAKAAHQLIQHQLLQIHRRNEVKSGHQKATPRVYYYIDYQHAVNVIKWRMWKLGKSLEDKSRSVMGGQGYVCPKCEKQYATLDVGSLQIVTEGFLCEICGTVIVDNDNAEEVKRNKDRMQRFNQQASRIVRGLQKADTAVLPPFDIVNWLAVNVPPENAYDTADGLAVATGGSKEAKVTVQMAKEGDEAAKRRRKEEEAEEKRKANALPVWIAQSTVTGELTVAGIREGTAGPSRTPSSPTKDAKPYVADEDADLDAYFASTQHEEAAAPPSPDRPPYSRPGSVASSVGPGVKRSRSREQDEGYASLENLRELETDADESGRLPKKAKTSADSSPVAFQADARGEEEEEEEDDAGEFEEVKMVSCGGKMMPLNEVTDDMATQLMTGEEYTAYIDLVM